MKALYEAYQDKAIILVVYIREAHPAKRDQTAEDAGWKAINGNVFYQPKTYEERRKLAETACTFWELPIPTLIDTMEPSIGGTYQAWPNRTYLIDTQGKIVYRGVKGPRGVNVHEAELELRKLLGITEGEPVTRPQRAPPSSGGRGRLGSRRSAPAKQSADESEDKPAKADAEASDSPDKSKKAWWEDDDSEEKAKKPEKPEGEAEQPREKAETPEPKAAESG